MKKIALTLLVLFVGATAFAQAKIEFKETVIDYGNVAYDSNGVRAFTFTNTGDQPLVIKDVKSTCYCTIPKKPEGEIAPGQTGEIQVEYDTTRQGPIRKTVTVYSNAENDIVPLKIKGYVQKKEQ